MKSILNNKGVTLLELMVVVAIIGILATLAIPNYLAGIPKMRVDGAADSVSSDLQMARMRAISKNSLYVVVFDQDNSTYKIYNDTDGHYLTTPTPNAAELVKSVDLNKEFPGAVFGFTAPVAPTDYPIPTPNKVLFKDQFGGGGEYQYEIFRPDGTALYDGAVYLVPKDDLTYNKYNRAKAVTVNAMTGMVKTWQIGTTNTWKGILEK